jgi:hypothetical protein
MNNITVTRCPTDGPVGMGCTKERVYDEASRTFCYMTRFICPKCGIRIVRFSDD